MGLSTTESAVANLRAEIGRRSLSGREFGRRMGWSKNTTVRKLNGQSALTVADLEQAAAVLDVSVLAFVQPVSEPVREAGTADVLTAAVCMALAGLPLLAGLIAAASP